MIKLESFIIGPNTKHDEHWLIIAAGAFVSIPKTESNA